MPIYEYKCQNCGYSFEQLQKVTDKLLRTCPKCGEKQLIKLISNTSFQLKGTGWYVTDFKNKKEKDSSKPKLEKKDPETPAKTKPKTNEKSN
jgi:putative FmdB family regulatory protein